MEGGILDQSPLISELVNHGKNEKHYLLTKLCSLKINVLWKKRAEGYPGTTLKLPFEFMLERTIRRFVTAKCGQLCH